MSSKTLKTIESSEQNDKLFYVVMNHEGQYSIWPEQKIIPIGWTTVGSPKPEKACLDLIEQHWIDMRPLSLLEKINSI